MNGLTRLANTGLYLQEFQNINSSQLYLNDQVLVDYATCCYLGLSHDIEECDIKSVKKWGLRNGWSRFSGNTPITKSLEAQLSNQMNCDCARLGQSVSLINLTVFKSLRKFFSISLIDEDAHVTLKSGLKSAFNKNKLFCFKSNNLKDLESYLKKYSKKNKKILIAVDGVYSMSGKIINLKSQLDLCKKYNCMIYIDDAHGFGVLGENGYGVVDGLSEEEMNHIIYAAGFSKCASNPVAFLLFPEFLQKSIDEKAQFLIFCGPPSTFHTAISLRHFKSFKRKKYKKLREKVIRLSRNVHRFCDENNIDYLSSSNFPILSVKINEEGFEEIVKLLKNSGIFAKAVVYPVVRKDDEIVRFTLNCMHTDHDVSVLKEAILKITEIEKVCKNEVVQLV